MTMTKLVDGIEVEMSPEEEANFLATLPQVAPPPPEDPVEKLKVFLDANPDVKALLGL